jgi:hypothetical protein
MDRSVTSVQLQDLIDELQKQADVKNQKVNRLQCYAQAERSHNDETDQITEGQHGNDAGQLGFLAPIGVCRSSNPTTAQDAHQAAVTALNQHKANLANLCRALDTLKNNQLI